MIDSPATSTSTSNNENIIKQVSNENENNEHQFINNSSHDLKDMKSDITDCDGLKCKYEIF